MDLLLDLQEFVQSYSIQLRREFTAGSLTISLSLSLNFSAQILHDQVPCLHWNGFEKFVQVN